MKELRKSLELKHADLLIWERVLRNSDTKHPRNANRLQQVRSHIRTVQIQIDMLNILHSIELESKKKGALTHATEQSESTR